MMVAVSDREQRQYAPECASSVRSLVGKSGSQCAAVGPSGGRDIDAGHDGRMRTFEELVSEAESADVTGWGFGWLEGRATEERPPWGYARLVSARLAQVRSALDVDTGGGEVVSEAPALPERMCVCESWQPNALRARDLLGTRGVEVHDTEQGAPLPFPDASFELVTARHPVSPDWPEIGRVLVPGGHYFAQHVGPASAFELIEFLLGPLPENRKGRDPKREVVHAERIRLIVTDLRTARCRMEFFDIGAIVWILRKCVWWVPDFTVARYRDKLLALDDQIRCDGLFVAHSARHLIEAQRQ
jgi:SAM-dependent methyltransferase